MTNKNKKVTLLSDNNDEITLVMNKSNLIHLLKKIPLLIIIFGLLMILWGIKDIVTFNSNKPRSNELIAEKTGTIETIEGKNELPTVVPTEITKTGDILDEGASTSKVTPTPEKFEENVSTPNKDLTAENNLTNDANIDISSKDSYWSANDYELNDLSHGQYTIQYGDTLWEIAEAIYGDGNRWTEILNENYSQIGFLPNGEQALIFPGQILTI